MNNKTVMDTLPNDLLQLFDLQLDPYQSTFLVDNSSCCVDLKWFYYYGVNCGDYNYNLSKLDKDNLLSINNPLFNKIVTHFTSGSVYSASQTINILFKIAMKLKDYKTLDKLRTKGIIYLVNIYCHELYDHLSIIENLMSSAHVLIYVDMYIHAFRTKNQKLLDMLIAEKSHLYPDIILKNIEAICEHRYNEPIDKGYEIHTAIVCQNKELLRRYKGDHVVCKYIRKRIDSHIDYIAKSNNYEFLVFIIELADLSLIDVANLLYCNEYGGGLLIKFIRDNQCIVHFIDIFKPFSYNSIANFDYENLKIVFQHAKPSLRELYQMADKSSIYRCYDVYCYVWELIASYEE